MLHRGTDSLRSPGAGALQFGTDHQVHIRTHPELLNNVQAGDTLAFDDGHIQVKVTDVGKDAIQTEVLQGGSLYGGGRRQADSGRMASVEAVTRRACTHYERGRFRR